MRHVAGILIGLLGTALGAAALGYGFGVVARGLTLFDVSATVLGAPLLLLGGLILGLVLISGRLSRWAPLTSGLVLLAVSGYALANPAAVGSAGLGGAGDLVGTQLGLALGMLMLCGTLAVRGRSRRSVPSGGYGGGQPPYPQAPPYPPNQGYPPPGRQYPPTQQYPPTGQQY